MGSIILNRKLHKIFSLRNNRIDKLLEENNKLKILNTQLKMENKELNWRFKNLNKNSKILTNNNNDLSIQVLSLVNDNNKSTKQIETLKQEKTTLQQNNTQKDNTIKTLTEENKKSTNQIETLKAENRKFNEEIADLKRKIEKSNKMKKYDITQFINFQEFLAKSYISPIVEAPFSFEDKRVFAFMDYLGKQLRNNVLTSDYKPLISVIMPTYNRKNIIQKAITSVLNQSYTNFELIIIDDGSDDGTYNLLKSIKDERINILHHEKNKGCSYSRNIGLKNAKGDIIMYLDSDNEWDPKYIETMIGAFIELPNADAVYSGQYLYKNFDSKPYAVRFGTYNKPLLHNHNYIDMNCFCHKSHVLNEVKGFDENLFSLVDWDFILKISNSFKIYSVPVILSKYYNHGSENRISNSNYDYIKTCQKVLDKNKMPIKKYPPLTKKISIIIPNYESLNEIKTCIKSILSHESKEMLEIIVVDNNSSKEVKNYLSDLETEGKIKLILNDINYGFSFAINQGIEISRKNTDILLLNNDAILTKGSLEHMQYCAYSLPQCGIIVPHELLFEGDNMISENVPYAYNNFECDVIPSKKHHNIINIPIFHDGTLLELNFAPFFCTYIKRDIYNKTLGLDPELGRHYRSDRIFSDFIRHYLQLKIYQAPHAFVYHRHQVATNTLRKTKKEEYDYMYTKNQWEPKLAKKLGFKNQIWDF